MTRLIHTHWQNFIKERPSLVNPYSPMRYVTHMSNYGILRIVGDGAEKFLQGQLTCDVMQLPPTGTLAAHCNPQGRVLSLFFLAKSTPNMSLKEQTANQFFLIMPYTMTALCLSALKKYAVFYRVTIEDVSEQNLVLGFNYKNNNHSLSFPRVELPDQRTLGIFSLEEAKAFWVQNRADLVIMPTADWHSISLQNLLPTIYPNTSGIFLPHELGLHQLNAISFDKGCYTGQEIIARMHYRGKLKKHINYFKINSQSLLSPGDEIHALSDVNLTMSLVDYQAIDTEYAHALFIAPQEITTYEPMIFSTQQNQTVRLIANEKPT